MNKLAIAILAIGAVGSGANAYAFDTTSLRSGMSYQEVATWHELFMEGGPSKWDMRSAYREMVRVSPLGDRGLNQIYRNFSASTLDPTIPGVDRTVRMQFSANPQQRKGYRREWLYGDAISRDGRFIVEGFDQPFQGEFGRTDKDIVLRHRPSNTSVRVEVKDVSPQSQIRNEAKLKRQIDGMAHEYKRTGEKQVWINRRPISTTISAYAASRGVMALGNVSTGQFQQTNQIPIKSALDLIERDITRSRFTASRARALRSVLSGAQIGAGAFLLYESVPAAYSEARSIHEGAGEQSTNWLGLAQYGSTAMAGGTMMLSGSALTGSLYATEAAAESLAGLGQWGGVAAIGFLVIAEGFSYARYTSGEISSREFWTQQWILGTALGGATIGSWLGGSAGLLTTGEPTILSTVGGFIGAWSGSRLGQWTATWYYGWRFAELDEAFGEAIYARYGVQ
jgi:hypothetical protein